MQPWQQIWRTNFTDLTKLADFLELNAEQRRELHPSSSFVLNLPLRLAQKITKRTLEDPLLKQFVPLLLENHVHEEFLTDPVGDRLSCSTPKLLHKYAGRVLLLLTSACAMHCRYCFRKNFDYDVDLKGFDREIEYIRADPTIQEIILSGGDPLSLSNKNLKELFKKLSSIPHLKRLRLHTRFPMGIPERIDCELLELLHDLSLQVWIVIHANHAREFDSAIWTALQQLRRQGAVLLCQSVLLKGVNDCLESLVDLCQTLVDHGILPYYLHQLDRVTGARHFEVAEERGRELIEQLTHRLSGYAVPKYVKEISQEPSKTALTTAYLPSASLY